MDNFHWKTYISNYPDLSFIKDYNTAYTHYIKYGIREGRTFEKQVMEKIIIIYYIYINPDKNWKSIVSGQFEDLKNVDLLNYSIVHCVICTPCVDLFNECKNLISCEFYYHAKENNFEYPGIKKLHELACIYPDRLFLYLHTKGMVFHYETNGRTSCEMAILRNTVKHWNQVYNIFKKDNTVDKAGLFPADTGFVWFNFFWIRGSFLKSRKPPIISSDRYYYEHYIQNEINEISCFNCFNLITFDKTTANQKQACLYLKKLTY
jgi:hypothetical protein